MTQQPTDITAQELADISQAETSQKETSQIPLKTEGIKKYASPCSEMATDSTLEEIKPPCTKPCNEPCEEPCPSHEELGCDENMVPIKSGVPALIQTGFYNAFKLAFDEILAEPQRILMIGGCRQRDFARFLGFLLPATEIVVLDTDRAEMEKAKEEVCCRFHFTHSTMEKLPFDDQCFDLTLGHHVMEYVQDWPRAVAEIKRVTKSNVMLTHPSALSWKMVQAMPGMKQDFEHSGIRLPEYEISKTQLIHSLKTFGKVKSHTTPMPWDVVITQVNSKS
jgi:hypothetical protein